jgi:hypothetical protein
LKTLIHSTKYGDGTNCGFYTTLSMCRAISTIGDDLCKSVSVREQVRQNRLEVLNDRLGFKIVETHRD